MTSEGGIDEIEKLVKKTRQMDYQLRRSNKDKRISPMTQFIDQEVTAGVTIARKSFDKLIQIANKPNSDERYVTLNSSFIDLELRSDEEVPKIHMNSDDGLKVRWHDSVW